MGSAVVVGIANGLKVEDIDAEGLVDSKVEESKREAKLDVSVDELLEALGVDVVTCSEPDDKDDCNALVSVGSPVTDAVTPVGNVRLAGGAAVAGPNFCIK